MTSVAITIMPPVLDAVVAGRCTALRRPAGGNLDRALVRTDAPARQLWIREPWHLAAVFGNRAPLSAAALGAVPMFPDQLSSHDLKLVGPRRISFTLPRQWHRRHLRVLAIERQRLQAISDEAIAAEGWPDRAAYALAWDRALQVGGFTQRDPTAWANNPEVLVFGFEFVAAPVPELELVAA